MFKPDNTKIGFKPYRLPCPVCQHQMYIHIADASLGPAGKTHVAHQIFKCVNCCLTLPFSQPLSRQHYQELVNRRGGVTVIRIWEDKQLFSQVIREAVTPKDKHTILKRLKALGYY